MSEINTERDIDLVQKSLKGDAKAFEALVRHYQVLVLTVVHRTLQDQEAARDITQETFVKAFRALKTFDGKRSFKTWLLAIASNTCIDYLRSRSSKGALSLEKILEEEPYLEQSFATAQKTSPEEEAEMNLFITKLSWALSLIPLRYRQAFILRYQFDLTYEEISQVMNENENTVRTLLHRAKERLRKLILETKNPFPNLE